FETFTVYMGHRLGYYATLAGNEWTTIAELAEKPEPLCGPTRSSATRPTRVSARWKFCRSRIFSFGSTD
ncbi:MAG: hypothetical protein WB853_15940, partial [Desulfobacterales bacterium]